MNIEKKEGIKDYIVGVAYWPKEAMRGLNERIGNLNNEM